MSEGFIREYWGDESSDEQLPSGYTRKDNYDCGFTEFWEGEIVCFGTRADHHTILTIFIGKGFVRQSVLEDPSQREWFPNVE